MDKICTSIEQSQQLIELGIDINTADMSWLSWMKDGKPRIGFNSELFNNLYDISDFRHEYMPAWSLSALLKLMPFQIIKDKRYGFAQWKGYNSQGETYCFKYASNIGTTLYETYALNNPTDSAFEMVCWLLENKLI